MGWGTKAPSGVSWSSAEKTGTQRNNFYDYWAETSIARGANNTVYVRVKLLARLYSYEYASIAPDPEMKASIRGAGASSWTDSSTYVTARPAFGATVTVKTVYWTGTAASGASVSVRSSNTSDYSSAATLTAPAYTTKFTISYNANGGSGTTAAQTKTYATAITLRTNGFTRAGYAFSGWNTKADGTGTSYAAGASYTANASVTLYAKWTPQQSLILSLSASVQTQGSIALQVDRKVSSYWHKAVFSSGGVTLHTSAAFETSLNTPVPRTWFNNFPNLATIGVTVTVRTYTNSGCTTQVGSAETGTVSVTADAGMVPAVETGWATAAPYNTGAASGLSGYIRNHSRAEITFDASKIAYANGATLGSYSVTYGGETATASPYRTKVLSTSGSINVTVKITDSRGRSVSEMLTVSVMDYAAPSLKDISIFHCDSGGEELDGGYYLSVKATGVFSDLNNQNSVTMSVAIAPAGGSYGAENTIYSGTATILSGVSPDSSWDVRITITDALGATAYYYDTIPTQQWAMKFRPNGSGVAFGKAPESDNLFEIDDSWRVKAKGIIDLVYPVGAIYMSVNAASPETLFGGTWERITGRFLLAATDGGSSGASQAAGRTGGEATHTLTTNEMAAHTHGSKTLTGYTRFRRYGTSGSGSDIAGIIGSSGIVSKTSETWSGTHGLVGAGGTNVSGPTADRITVNATHEHDSVGGGQAHNNMPPYLAVYVWKRTA